MSSVCLDVILHTLFHSANRAVGDISAMDVVSYLYGSYFLDPLAYGVLRHSKRVKLACLVSGCIDLLPGVMGADNYHVGLSTGYTDINELHAVLPSSQVGACARCGLTGSSEQCTSFMDTTETSQVPVTRVAGKVLIQDEPQYQLPQVSEVPCTHLLILDQFDSYDMSNVDVVLLSCAQQMLALPYLMMVGPVLDCSTHLLLDL